MSDRSFLKTFKARSPDALERLAQDIALGLPAGTGILLKGDLGAGKTTFARGFIRCLLPGEAEIPSPTYPVVQSYSGSGFAILHADLYRISDPDELEELGLFEDGASRYLLVEWPERAPGVFGDSAVEISIQITEDGGRRISLKAPLNLKEKLERSLLIRNFISGSIGGKTNRTFLTGDASTRSYERSVSGDAVRILMNSPAMPDGPPVRDGKPYSRLAHLAETITPYIAVTGLLEERGFCVPHIHAADPENGFALLDDLGSDSIVADGAPIAERYAASVDCLAALHRCSFRTDVAVAPGRTHHIPFYDYDALTAEIALFSGWHIPFALEEPLDAEKEASFFRAWHSPLERMAGAKETLVLRDFHSPNILWQSGKGGVDRVGLIDFQDAVIGPAAYDVASLLQDARITVPDDLERTLLDAYCAARAGDPGFDEADFRRLYAICAAQRATKILGIFVRLSKRDGKDGYLGHIPRIRHYLKKALAHAALEPVRLWFDDHIPGYFGKDC